MFDVSCFWVTCYVFISIPPWCLCQSLHMVHGQTGVCSLACVACFNTLLQCNNDICVVKPFVPRVILCCIPWVGSQRWEIPCITKRSLVSVTAPDGNLLLFEFSLIYFVYFPNPTVLSSCKIDAANKIMREVSAINLIRKIGFSGFRFLRFSLAPPGKF